MNFKDDQDLSNLIQKLPNRPTTTTTTTTTKLLTDLSIDFNKPQTILSISNHLNILMGVLKVI